MTSTFGIAGPFLFRQPVYGSWFIAAWTASTSGDSEIFGRIAFGAGAIITWLCLVLVAVGGRHKLVGRDKATRTANLPPGHAPGAMPSAAAAMLKTAQKRVALGPRRESA